MWKIQEGIEKRSATLEHGVALVTAIMIRREQVLITYLNAEYYHVSCLARATLRSFSTLP